MQSNCDQNLTNSQPTVLQQNLFAILRTSMIWLGHASAIIAAAPVCMVLIFQQIHKLSRFSLPTHSGECRGAGQLSENILRKLISRKDILLRFWSQKLDLVVSLCLIECATWVPSSPPSTSIASHSITKLSNFYPISCESCRNFHFSSWTVHRFGIGAFCSVFSGAHSEKPGWISDLLFHLTPRRVCASAFRMSFGKR